MIRPIEGIAESETINHYEIITAGKNRRNNKNLYVKVHYLDGDSDNLPIADLPYIQDIQEFQAGEYVRRNMWMLQVPFKQLGQEDTEKPTFIYEYDGNEDFWETEQGKLVSRLNYVEQKKKSVDKVFLAIGLVGGTVYAMANFCQGPMSLISASGVITSLDFGIGMAISSVNRAKVDKLKEQLNAIEDVKKYALYMENLNHFTFTLPHYLDRDSTHGKSVPREIITLNDIDTYTTEDVREQLSIVARHEAADSVLRRRSPEAYQKLIPDVRHRVRTQ